MSGNTHQKSVIRACGFMQSFAENSFIKLLPEGTSVISLNGPTASPRFVIEIPSKFRTSAVY